MMTTSSTQHTIETYNSLLRGEISAIETYSQTIHKYPGEFYTPTLEQIREEHLLAASRLKESIAALGGTPDHTSGTWGGVANTVHAVSHFFGENSALGSLIQGEDHGRNQFKSALEDENVLPECKMLVRDSLLPALDRHIEILKSIHPQ